MSVYMLEKHNQVNFRFPSAHRLIGLASDISGLQSE